MADTTNPALQTVKPQDGWLALQDDPRVNEIVSGLYRRFKDWSQRGFSADDVTWCEVKADVIRLIEAALAQPAPVQHYPELLRGVAEALESQAGTWRSCSGCHELNEGHDTGPYSAVFRCHLGNGCSECGGIGAVWDTTDYAGMAAHALTSRDAAPAPAAAGGVTDERAAFITWLGRSYPHAYDENDATHMWRHSHVVALAWQARAALTPPAVAAPAVPDDWRLVPLAFVQGFCTLAHNYSLTAVPPFFYDGMAGDAFKNAYRRCGEDLAKLRPLLDAAPPTLPSAAPAQAGETK